MDKVNNQGNINKVKGSSQTMLQSFGVFLTTYSEVPNRRADRNKQAGLEESATLLAYLPSRFINEQRGFFHLLHEKLRAGLKENLKNLREHAFRDFRVSRLRPF